MCGIAGVIGLGELEIVQSMVVAMDHRGPDDQGIWSSEHAVLGMSRLAIIDLSPAGHQPMSTPDGRYWIVYNGETYNFQFERHLLEQKGHRFVSTSDTEVVLRLYQEYGPACLEHMRGMFAFAIWDTVENVLFAARDQLGIKPFLYAEIPGQGLVFASELKALLASGLIARDVDWYSFQNYMLLGSVYPPHTMVAGVRSLLPGQYLMYKNGLLEITTYWDITAETTPGPFQGNLQEAAEELRCLFSESTREQRVSDVPVGVFLSGGLDSASILAMMVQSSSSPVKSFAVGFEEENQAIDETQYAAETAHYIGSEHHNIVVGAKDVENSLDHFITGLDQPSIDGLNSYFVSEFASSQVTVALSGVGGDELFAGYSRARRILADQSQPNLLHSTAIQPIVHQSTRTLARFSLRAAHGLRYRLTDRLDLVSNYTMSHRIFSEFELERYLNDDFLDIQPLISAANIVSLFDRPDLPDAWKRVSRLDLKTFMSAQLLRDMDAVGMIHSLEVRFPLLDLRIVNFARSLPVDLVFGRLDRKSQGGLSSTSYTDGQVKRVLVEATRGLLPEALKHRRKTGFVMPHRFWLNGSLSTRVHEVLMESQAGDLPFSQGSLQNIMTDFRNGRASWQKIWVLFVFCEWKRLVLQK